MRHFVLVTARWFTWALLSLASFLLSCVAVMTSEWVVGYRNHTGVPHYATEGIYGRCTRLSLSAYSSHQDADELFCGPYARSFSEIDSVAWKASLVLMAGGVLLVGLAGLIAVVTLCVRQVRQVSLYSVAGILQVVSCFLLIVGMGVYPIGWSNERINSLCHPGRTRPRAYYLGSCWLGRSFFCGVAGTASSLLGAVLAIAAQSSARSRAVDAKVRQGYRIIMLP